MDNKTLINHLQKLKQFKTQSICWTRASILVSTLVIAIGVSWNWIVSHHLIWTVATLGLIVAVLWWYWTMNIIKTVIKYREEETNLLTELILDIREMKESLRKLG